MQILVVGGEDVSDKVDNWGRDDDEEHKHRDHHEEE
jgi:hypothetical protein